MSATENDAGSLALGAAALFETLRITVPTLLDAGSGRLTREGCDARLRDWSRRVLSRAEVDLRIHGGLPEGDETFVVMSNHQSHFDVPCIYQAFPRSLRMVAKAELFRIPLFGRAMRAAEFVEVDRGDPTQARASLGRAAERLRSGVNVWIAPEGTRSETGQLGPFKKGGFLLALETGLRILPATIDGTRSVLPVNAPGVRRGQRVDLTFHAPVDPGSYGRARRDDLVAEVRRVIGAALR